MTNINKILKEIIEAKRILKKEEEKLNKITEEFCEKLKKEIRKRKISADVFIGGSLAKKTLINKKNYDVDIFVRFDKKYGEQKISELFGGLFKHVSFGKGERVHGSRDYFQFIKNNVNFEVVPVVRIEKPDEARNVTDLSYFHIEYVLNAIKKNPRLSSEIVLAKNFVYSCNCYGAESYIKGFSGYALELLLIYYKTFLNFVKNLRKIKKKKVIDMAEFYKNAGDVLTNLNEAKLESPIVLIDPTFKERNVLAVLSSETFARFQKACREFLKHPSKSFFELQKFDESVFKKKFKGKNVFFVKLLARTDKQSGDIAGSKLLKFFNFLISKVGKYFEILDKHFLYDGGKEARFYFLLKKREKIIVEGPPIKMKENVVEFRKKHKNFFVKAKRICAVEKISFKPREFFDDLKKREGKILKEMGIRVMKVV